MSPGKKKNLIETLTWVWCCQWEELVFLIDYKSDLWWQCLCVVNIVGLVGFLYSNCPKACPECKKGVRMGGAERESASLIQPGSEIKIWDCKSDWKPKGFSPLKKGSGEGETMIFEHKSPESWIKTLGWFL